jgi:hypothetical protein
MTVELVSSVYATGLESHFENHPLEMESINKTGPSVYPFRILFDFTIKGERSKIFSIPLELLASSLQCYRLSMNKIKRVVHEEKNRKGETVTSSLNI